MNCSLCEVFVPNAEVAIARDWLPGFYDGDVWRNPCCAGCARTHVVFSAEDGEYVRWRPEVEASSGTPS